MVRIGLFDEGGLLALPNLAIARLAGYWQRQGAEVVYNRLGQRYDRAYVSGIFPAHWPQLQTTMACLDTTQIIVGGPGYALATAQPAPWPTLPVEVEAAEPDFAFWPDWPWSLGYSYRGCPRGCEFCVVPLLEGRQVRRVAVSYRDLLRPEARVAPRGQHLVDLAPNILAAPEAELAALWREVRELGLTVDYSQGLDVRFITQAVAEELATLPIYVRWRDRSGRWQQRRRLYLALDGSALLPQFEQAARWLLGAGVKPSSVYVYILERPGEEADALARVQTVAQLRMRPYVMPLHDYQDDGLRRWVNRRYYQFVPLAQYRRRRSRRQMRLPEPGAVATGG